MFTSLNAGAIGIRGVDLAGTLELARSAGFEAIDFSITEAAALVDEKGVEYVKNLFAAAGVRPGTWSTPVEWRKDNVLFEADLQKLPRLAALGAELGCNRTSTWMLPGSNERPFAWNLEWHVHRFRPLAEILAHEGCQFGIEFIGPKGSRNSFRYEFIYTLEGLLELAKAIGTGNVGLLLDAWHLYTSGGSAEDVRKLKNSDVVTVHVNDAPAGVPVDQQVDNVRCLPMETGVIDLVGFLTTLQSIGYDGPVTPEPFSKRINALPPGEAAALAGKTMLQAWGAAGL